MFNIAAPKIDSSSFYRTSYGGGHSDWNPNVASYECGYCHRLFTHKRSRDRHVKLHTGEKKHQCPYCSSAFTRSDHLRIHIKTHDSTKPFHCALCNRHYCTPAALSSHLQVHTRNADHQIPDKSIMLSPTTSTESSLEISESDRRSDSFKPGKCASPGASSAISLQSPTTTSSEVSSSFSPYNASPSSTTPTTPVMASHFGTNFPALANLPNPDKLSPNSIAAAKAHYYQMMQAYQVWTNYFKNFQADTPQLELPSSSQSPSAASSSAEFECPHCGKQLPTTDLLDSHIVEHLIVKSTIYRCEACNSEHESRTSLSDHSMAHHTRPLLQCLSCKRMYESEDELRSHINSNHGASVDKYSCALCKDNQSSGDKNDLLIHFKSKHHSFGSLGSITTTTKVPSKAGPVSSFSIDSLIKPNSSESSSAEDATL